MRFAAKITATVLSVCILFCGCSTNKKTDTPQQENTPAVNISGCREFNMFAIRESSLNPLLATSPSSQSVLSLVFSPLFTVSQSFDYVPVLAEKLDFSSDCTVVDVTLKNNITWDDGTNFTSADVDYTINKIMEYETLSPYFQNLSNLTGYATNGTYGYRFVLENPDSGFAGLLTFPIIKKGSASGDMSLVGTGQYKIVENKDFSYFSLEHKNPSSKENVCKIKVSLLPDKQSAYSSAKLGQMDFLKLSYEDAAAYSVESSENYISSNSNDYTFLAVNHTNSALKNSTLRKIIAEIVSSENVIKDLMPQFAISADSPINPNASFAVEKETKIEDIKTALEKEGYVFGSSDVRSKKVGNSTVYLSFNLLINGDNTSKVVIADYLKTLFGSYGIKLNINALPFATYKDALSTQTFDLALCETSISLNNDYTFLMGTEGNLSLGGYSSEKMDGILANVLKASDETKRNECLKQLQLLFYKDMPHIPLWFKTSKILYGANKFETISSGGINNDFSSVSIWKLDME